MKTPNIKYNLKFHDSKGDEVAIRDLADLRDHLNLSDLFFYFEKGILERWLLSIGLSGQAEQLSAVRGECDLQKKVMSILQIIGFSGNEQLVKDFVCVKQRQASRTDCDAGLPQSECDDSNYMTLMAKLLSIECCADESGLFHVEEIQKCCRQGAWIVRKLLRNHESCFITWFESDRYLPWWLQLLFWSTPATRPYICAVPSRNPFIYKANAACVKGRDLFGDFLRVNDRVYVVVDAMATGDEIAFCEKQFGLFYGEDQDE